MKQQKIIYFWKYISSIVEGKYNYNYQNLNFNQNICNDITIMSKLSRK